MRQLWIKAHIIPECLGCPKAGVTNLVKTKSARHDSDMMMYD